MDRRDFLRLMGGTAVLSLEFTRLGGHLVRAQETTKLSGLGLPDLKVTLTDAGYQISPAQIPAGWTLVTLDNQQSAGDNSADIMLLPPGETPDSILASLATPAAAPPAWGYQTTFASSPWTAAGTSAQAVILLTAGDWMVFNPEAPLSPASLTVTKGDAAAATPPALTVNQEVELQEFSFLGLEKPLSAGQQIWKVTNTGHQPHLMVLNQLPDGTTQAQFMDMVNGMMSATPPPGGQGPAGPPAAGGCATLSPEQSLYLALDLATGTYGAICFFPDKDTGAPHALMGMVQVFTVK
ncbi:MAG: hypothetical protein ACJ789_09735 [Thermomicrobiales bacterium]